MTVLFNSIDNWILSAPPIPLSMFINLKSAAVFTENLVRVAGKARVSRNLWASPTGTGTPGIDPGFLPRQRPPSLWKPTEECWCRRLPW